MTKPKWSPVGTPGMSRNEGSELSLTLKRLVGTQEFLDADKAGKIAILQSGGYPDRFLTPHLLATAQHVVEAQKLRGKLNGKSS